MASYVRCIHRPMPGGRAISWLHPDGRYHYRVYNGEHVLHTGSCFNKRKLDKTLKRLAREMET